MCMAHEMRCFCGARSASFHFRDNILPEQVLTRVYCPVCSGGVTMDPGRMVADNGWIIQYDMEIANAVGTGRVLPAVSPAVIFDEGYCTWSGLYPGDAADSIREREEITALARTDPKAYVLKLRTWANERMTRLRNEGWRKAKNAA